MKCFRHLGFTYVKEISVFPPTLSLFPPLPPALALALFPSLFLFVSFSFLPRPLRTLLIVLETFIIIADYIYVYLKKNKIYINASPLNESRKSFFVCSRLLYIGFFKAPHRIYIVAVLYKEKKKKRRKRWDYVSRTCLNEVRPYFLCNENFCCNKRFIFYLLDATRWHLDRYLCFYACNDAF